MAWEPGTLLELETERLTLRTMTREDVTDRFVSWLADPEVMQGLNLPRQRLTRAQAVRWVLGHDNRNQFCLGVHLQEVGLIGLFTVSCDPKHMTAETAVVIGEREQWGKNIVLEGRARLLDFLFDELSMHKVIGRPHGRNVGSIFNYKALGFQCEAVLREQSRSIIDDSRLDQLIFGLLREEWLSRRNKPAPKS